MFKNKLTPKIFLFLISTDILETLTQFCFKKSAAAQSWLQIKSIQDILFFIKANALSPFLWLGFLCVLLIFIIWATILSKIDLSVAVPIASFSYVLIPIVSIIFLQEKVSILRWVGIFFIILGVISVSISTQEKTKITP
jgi:drug/metabolite transporter (DMT)-like permease